MTIPDEALLDPAPLLAPEVAALETSLARALRTTQDLVLVPSEATLALEAAATGLGAPGVRALNVVTGPYGEVFGRWLTRAGATVTDLAVPFDRGASSADVERALDDAPYDLLSVVHAEAATGAVSPLAAIAAAGHRHSALVVVDAVASLGAEPLDIDGWDLDVCAIGTQKGWAGPFGISALTVSERAWEVLGRHPHRESSLSLLDWKAGWIDAGRTAVPIYLPVLETRALAAAVARVEIEGTGAVVERHRRAAAATRAGLLAAGLAPWVADAAHAAGVATLLTAPDGVAPAALVEAAAAVCPSPLEVAPGSLRAVALRVSHTGRRATLPSVLAALTALVGGLGRLGHPLASSPGAALDAAIAAWGA